MGGEGACTSILMIDAIMFDLVGVLLFLRADYVPERLIDEIDRQIGAVTNDLVFKERIMREYSFTEVRFNALLESVVDKYEPYVPLWSALPKIRTRYKLGIINNGTTLTYPLLEEKYHLSRQFDVFVSSAVEGICKPDPAIYLRACARLDTRPQKCLFMDDSQENVSGSQRAGMQAFQWLDRTKGLQKLNSRMAA